MRRVLMTVAAVVVSLGLVACSGEAEPGVPTGEGGSGGTPTTGGEANPGLPHSGAPKVETPLADTASWEADPCSAVTDSQFQSVDLEIRVTEPDPEGAFGPTCDWVIDGGGSFSGAFIAGGGGLSAIYANNEKGRFDVFEVIEDIEGQPAVMALGTDSRSDGVCAADVGIRDDMAYTVIMTADPGTPQGDDPCKWASTIAGLAVQTMKGGS